MEAEAAFLTPKPKKERPTKKQAPALVKPSKSAAKKNKPQPKQNAAAA